jgi:hypothetical protein
VLENVRRAATALLGPRDPTQAAAILLVVGLAVASAAYLLALFTSRTASLRWIVGLSLVFQLTLLAMPGLLSTDLLTYATFGRLAAIYGQNPYLSAPSAVAPDPLVQWLDTRPEHASPYGPVWTLVSIGLARLTAPADPLLQAFSYRVLGSLAVLVGMAVVWGLTRDAPGLLVFAWNPLLLVETVGSGHNDAFMMVLALAALLPLRGGRSRWPQPPLVAEGALTLAALVKYVTAVLMVYVAAQRRAWGSLAACLVLAVVLWLPWASQPEVVLNSVSAAGGERYVNALVDLPTGWIASHVVDRAGQDLPAAEASVRAWPRAIVRVLFVLYVVVETWRLWRSGPTSDPQAILNAAARSLLVLVLVVVTQVLPWYFVWPVALAAVLGWSSTLARVAVAYSVVYLPVFYAIHEDLAVNPTPWLLGYAILPLVLMARRQRA